MDYICLLSSFIHGVAQSVLSWVPRWYTVPSYLLWHCYTFTCVREMSYVRSTFIIEPHAIHATSCTCRNTIIQSRTVQETSWVPIATLLYSNIKYKWRRACCKIIVQLHTVRETSYLLQHYYYTVRLKLLSRLTLALQQQNREILGDYNAYALTLPPQ